MKLPLRSAQQNSVKLLQITDTHLFASDDDSLLSINTEQSFKAVVEAVAQDSYDFDAIISSGDICQDHSEGAYKKFAAGIERLKQPCFWLPGNHDEQSAMQSVLPSPQIKQESHVLLGDSWQMVLLDSQVVGVPHGRLSDSQLDLLEQKLTEHSDRHCLVLLHHHPVPAGSAWLDQHILKNSDEFWQKIGRFPMVKAVVCGHIHQELDKVVKQVRVLATPSTCVQFKPISDDFALDDLAPGWRELELHDDGTITTQVKRLPAGQFLPDFNAAGY
ncbi:3',5'-cyclic-AMP phosphodiesterase [Vibrio marisflavi]|uniref:3',5'-cyclic adenosine monophosphate phosphodiesterase CpdA n=1 Tax=Vibrio marisflavi CECT 7928 TaxID=634439 RepID=A0ABN8EB92_9VIBR|nr:3',5'-cyclic-AMP phosphodiesterase [Vibrio marisflavi]CAH0541346.1 3',5'-cyclic adenosine monophosphate phosphodiesterase CpdA [Vibrio marisflavi CECT 7928]